MRRPPFTPGLLTLALLCAPGGAEAQDRLEALRAKVRARTGGEAPPDAEASTPPVQGPQLGPQPPPASRATARPAAAPAPSGPAEEGGMGPSRFDEAKARAAGFALVADPGKVAFTFDVPERRTTEHLLEIQALLIKPGEEESPTRHQRLYQFLSVPDGTTPSGALRDQVKIQSALYSEPSKDPKVVLLPRTELQGLEILVAYHPSGVEDQEVGLPTQDRALDWLRLPLAERKVEVGKGWVANLPVDVGDRREVTSALYGLRRVVRFQGHDVAVLEGRFRSRMQERDDLRRGSLGQDRVLFDLDDGVVLYREFRTEAEMAARGSDAIHRVRARIKGIVFERALFAGTKDRAGRLAAASDLF